MYEDAVSSLALLRDKGYASYILTNNYPEITDNIAGLGLLPYIDGAIVSSHVGFEKPRAELYAYAKRVAGEPDICYMIGDNPIADIDGARCVGMKTVYIHNGHIDTADFCADTLADAVDFCVQ